jgi:hypothetical protein
MVPIGEALCLLSQQFDEDILRLFHHALTSSFFSFNSQFYKQTDSVAMGSPLSPVIANFFMKYSEEMALEGQPTSPSAGFTTLTTHSSSDPMVQASCQAFLLNSVQGNIQFIMETERDDHLPFLDIDIFHKPDDSLGHKVYRKPTHTNPYLNSNSHHHPSNKQAYCPCRCTGPDPFVTRRACTVNWGFSEPLSGRTTMATSRSSGLSIHQ